MKLSLFDFKLPKELIAQYPLDKRSSSRLLVLNRKNKTIYHNLITDLPKLLAPGDLLIFNNTKVLKARFFAKKETGGKVEILLERILSSHTALAQIKANHSLKIGTKIYISSEITAEILERKAEFYELKFCAKNNLSLTEIPEKYGSIPLPPYIEHTPESIDNERYQSIFAKHPGAVAAPTASLHFDMNLIANCIKQNINIAFITLHVGAGTFKPVKMENICEHKMHAEYIEISKETCDLIKKTKANKHRVIAVGTTCVRCLEATNLNGITEPYAGDINIFIYPGYKFRTVDGIITNFHLPKSTLFMLVSAFADLDFIKKAYEIAINRKYRFFSYGDAMLIL